MIICCKRVLFVLICVTLLAGCGIDSHPVTPTSRDDGAVDLDTIIAKAGHAKRSLVILIGEFGNNGADSKFRDLLDDPAIKSRSDGLLLLTIDLSISSNRAAAARYHLTQTPILVCLTPRGLIVNRDAGPVSSDSIIKRMDGLSLRAAALDAKFDQISIGPTWSDVDLRLGDFLIAQQNDREAIPYFSKVAKSDEVGTNDRIHAWVALSRAHLWVAEPEKGRHEAKDLIATLGPTNPDAIAGGNLVLGLQDATARRFALAHQEFAAAVAAAPNSDYAKQAAKALMQLPKETR